MIEQLLLNEPFEVTIFSALLNQSPDKLNKLESKLKYYSKSIFREIPFGKTYISIYRYDDDIFGVLLTIEYDSKLINWITDKKNKELVNEKLYSVLLYQQYCLEALYTCICYFPNDEDFFDEYFAKSTLAIIDKYDREIRKSKDYNGSSSLEWITLIREMGKRIINKDKIQLWP